MTTYYLGETTDGRIVSRKSTNPNFTHAAMKTSDGGYTPLPSFSTSPAGAVRNFYSTHREGTPHEVVALRQVDGPTFRAATKGINPKTGRAL